MPDLLTERLRTFVHEQNIHPDPFFQPYHSGVYAVVDCVFSSQARYAAVTAALNRMGKRLPDTQELRFSRFLADVQSLGAEAYAVNVLTRQRLSGRLKVEVACDVARFFVEHGIETRAKFQERDIDQSEQLVLTDLVAAVHGVGPVLARYLLILLGREDHVKPDTLLSRLLADIGGTPQSMEAMRRAVSIVAAEIGATPARLDNALWKYESGGRRSLSWKTGE
ncbi:hypothetical protein ACFOPQ_17630 [Deinococcus antarcticus]|uniref:DNA-3-methyladenine glycosylase III n=1 Tax=Deinococcus antarcticus TaxID=1298767 RepID=A0ABV8AA41_9DEIO